MNEETKAEDQATKQRRIAKEIIKFLAKKQIDVFTAERSLEAARLFLNCMPVIDPWTD